MRIWKKSHGKFICQWLFLYIRNSIGMQNMTEDLRSKFEVVSCILQIIRARINENRGYIV